MSNNATSYLLAENACGEKKTDILGDAVFYSDGDHEVLTFCRGGGAFFDKPKPLTDISNDTNFISRDDPWFQNIMQVRIYRATCTSPCCRIPVPTTHGQGPTWKAIVDCPPKQYHLLLSRLRRAPSASKRSIFFCIRKTISRNSHAIGKQDLPVLSRGFLVEEQQAVDEELLAPALNAPDNPFQSTGVSRELSSGMHPGIIVAINVGVTVLVAAALTALLLWHRRRSRVNDVVIPSIVWMSPVNAFTITMRDAEVLQSMHA